jgi:hypothetical protein
MLVVVLGFVVILGESVDPPLRAYSDFLSALRSPLSQLSSLRCATRKGIREQGGSAATFQLLSLGLGRRLRSFEMARKTLDR